MGPAGGAVSATFCRQRVLSPSFLLLQQMHPNWSSLERFSPSFLWSSRSLTIIGVCANQHCHSELRVIKVWRETTKGEQSYATISAGCIEVRTQGVSTGAPDVDVVYSCLALCIVRRRRLLIRSVPAARPLHTLSLSKFVFEALQ